MKSVFDASTRKELTGRINSLTPENKAQWGKMNVYQMVRHCTRCDDMYLGTLPIKRVFIGRLIGGIFLKKFLKDDRPFDKNAPTSPLLTTGQEAGDLEEQKKEWVKRIVQFAGYNNPRFVHPFFGPMTKEQVGFLAYKHEDHHLRQFGA